MYTCLGLELRGFRVRLGCTGKYVKRELLGACLTNTKGVVIHRHLDLCLEICTESTSHQKHTPMITAHFSTESPTVRHKCLRSPVRAGPYTLKWSYKSRMAFVVISTELESLEPL